MRKRTAELLISSTERYECAEGESAVSFTSSRDGSIENILIYGNAEHGKGSLGVFETWSGLYETCVRVHGRNFMGGEEFYNLANENLGSDLVATRTGDLFTYSYDYVGEYSHITTPGMPSFKTNTVYTLRFHYTGNAQSAVGIKIVYTDGWAEDIWSGATGREHDIAFSSVYGKTISHIAPSMDFRGTGTIDLSSFGIFEGVTEYSDFEEYSGELYSIYTQMPLAGASDGERSLYDVFDWKSKKSTHKVYYTTVTNNSNINLYDGSATPVVAKIYLPLSINIEDPLCLISGCSYRDTYDEIVGYPGRYTINDKLSLLFSVGRGYTPENFRNYFKTSRSIIYNLAWDHIEDDECMDIPITPKGYVGIEVYGGILPSKIQLYYRK